MAIRDMDVAAAVIGIRPMYAKLRAPLPSAPSSSAWPARCGPSCTWVRGSRRPSRSTVSFRLLFMVIIGGLGSIMGSVFGAAFIVVLPIVLNQFPAAFLGLFGIEVHSGRPHAELMIFGALIVFFLIVEPHGLAKVHRWAGCAPLPACIKRPALWPFPHCTWQPAARTAWLYWPLIQRRQTQ